MIDSYIQGGIFDNIPKNIVNYSDTSEPSLSKALSLLNLGDYFKSLGVEGGESVIVDEIMFIFTFIMVI